MQLAPRLRLPLSFSLRTLMLGITALAVWLGYNINWIHQRRAFLSEQLVRHLATEYTLTYPDGHGERRRIEPERANQWWREQLGTRKPAPWSLRFFSEPGVDKLWVVVSARDITMRNWPQPEYDPGIPPWAEITTLQPDYQRAKRLFPEALVRPVAPNEFIIERNGGGMTGWTLPGVTVRNLAKPATLRLICDDRVPENSVLKGSFELNAPLEGVAIIIWHTRDGTAVSWRQNNYEESGDFILAEPGQKEFGFTIKTGALTEDQRVAGGATFNIELRTVVGASPKTKEKTITMLPAGK